MRMNFPSTSLEKVMSTEGSTTASAKTPREKPFVSPDMIRQKLESHKAAKQQPVAQAKLEAKAEIKTEVKAAPMPDANVEVGPTKLPALKDVAAASEEVVVPTTSLINDPKAPETQEKLRHLISNGGFNFSDKERKVLGEVLKT